MQINHMKSLDRYLHQTLMQSLLVGLNGCYGKSSTRKKMMHSSIVQVLLICLLTKDIHLTQLMQREIQYSRIISQNSLQIQQVLSDSMMAQVTMMDLVKMIQSIKIWRLVQLHLVLVQEQLCSSRLLILLVES